MTKKITYKDSGVDINQGNLLIDRIKQYTKATDRPGVVGGIGGFGGLFSLKELNLKDPILVSATDGVGTKLKIAQEIGCHDYIGSDLVAMCVNDLIVQGAEPLFFLDYFACSKLDVDVAEAVVKSIALACQEAESALIGGETAEMPGMYSDGDYDLAGFAVGAVERDSILPRKSDIEKGDVILGLKASGVHSNGFSLVRKLVSEYNLYYNKVYDFTEGETLGEFLLRPTKIYVKSVKQALKTGNIKALAHITGGGFTENIPRVLEDGRGFEIYHDNLPELSVFKWIEETSNIGRDEMYKTFNCGIGMVIIASKLDVAELEDILTSAGEEVFTIGAVT